MAKCKGPIITLQVPPEVSKKIEQRLETLRNSGQETDRSKWLRGLIFCELQKIDGAKASGS